MSLVSIPPHTLEFQRGGDTGLGRRTSRGLEAPNLAEQRTNLKVLGGEPELADDQHSSVGGLLLAYAFFLIHLGRGAFMKRDDETRVSSRCVPLFGKPALRCVESDPSRLARDVARILGDLRVHPLFELIDDGT